MHSSIKEPRYSRAENVRAAISVWSSSITKPALIIAADQIHVEDTVTRALRNKAPWVIEVCAGDGVKANLNQA